MTEAAAGAEAKAAQLRAREAEVLAASEAIDADGEALRRVDELRAAIAGKVTGADLDAVRAALAGLFTSFTVDRFSEGVRVGDTVLEPEDVAPVVAEDGRWVLTPEPRTDALTGLIGDDGAPLLRRLAILTTDNEGLVR